MSTPSEGQGLSLVVNGKPQTVHVPENAMLLDVLRHELGLASARFGCGTGACGACHVLVEGHAVTACDTPMWSVAGKAVVTVEGLGTAQAPHALQRAFIDAQAMQCGYCISGILISAAALLQKTPHPTEDEVRHALDRNLCRCGAHNRIVRAVLKAAEALP
jgi:nicotinate dehydrogenase subunit A